MFSWICRIGGGDMILEILIAQEWGWPGDVEGVEVFDSAKKRTDVEEEFVRHDRGIVVSEQWSHYVNFACL